MGELSTTVRRRPDRLPSTYRPMADAITGGRRVLLSTDTASRRALRSVGKVAATTDDVIHLDPSATPRRRIDEVIAHELTHVAHPSATPRFFDDVDHSPEERKAEQVAGIIARSPLAPNSHAARSTSTPTPDPTRAKTDRTILRSPAAGSSSARSSTPTPSPTASVRAASLAAEVSTAASSTGSLPGSAAMLRRALDRSTSSGGAPPTVTTGQSDDTLRRAAPAVASDPDVGAGAGADAGAGAGVGGTDPFASSEAEDWFLEQVERHFDVIVDRLEARMIVELERRGGRTWGAL